MQPKPIFDIIGNYYKFEFIRMCLKVRAYQGKELNQVTSGGKMRNDPEAATNKWGNAP